MSLNIQQPSTAGAVERPRFVQRLMAILGLTGLVLAWAVVLLPCAVWLLFNLVYGLFQPTARQQA